MSADTALRGRVQAQEVPPPTGSRAQAGGAILIVENEWAIRELLCSHLGLAGYLTAVAVDGQAAIASVAGRAPDLIVLARRLPDMDGLEVMRRVRERFDRMAIILLTDRDEVSDHVMGLRLGADDCMVKPVYFAELAARIEAVLRRFGSSCESELPLVFDGLTIEPAIRRVFVGESEIRLTRREFDLFLFLARHPGRAFTHSQLMELVWGYSFYTDTATVTVHIRRLRAKVESAGAPRRSIQIVWGVGYRFCPDGSQAAAEDWWCGAGSGPRTTAAPV